MSRRAALRFGAASFSLPLLGSGLLAGCSGRGSDTPTQPFTGKLVFWDMPWGGPAYDASVDKLLADYHPNGRSSGVTVKRLDWTSYAKSFDQAVAAGTPPAVSSGSAFSGAHYADSGDLAYVDGVVDNLKASGAYDDLLPGMLESAKTPKGYVGVPWSVDQTVFWYNERLLDRAGVTVPRNWEDLFGALVAVKRKVPGAVPLATGYAQEWPGARTSWPTS